METGRDRVFLLLQGPMSYFFTHLAAALRARGATVGRVLLCPGDALFWRGPGGVHYRGRPEDWPEWLEGYMAREGVTDVVCLGDGRRWHADALPVARAAGARIHVVEQGYIRPHFLTVEPDGTGGASRFPRDWEEIARLAGPPPEPPGHRASFLAFSAMDVGFQLANLLFSWATHPHYRPHALDGPLREWSGWILKKALPIRARRRRLRAAEARIAAHEGPLFLFPLQLETDYQIRLHGPPEGLRATLARVVASFAAHAPADALLAVKPHPLDNGWTPWEELTRAAARAAGAADRVLFLDGGDLDAMLARAAGVATVNSTVGLSALRAGIPVVALGRAIYDLPGLAWRGGLDGFWTRATPPDAGRLRLLLGALAATIQVPGGFDGTGARPGAAAMAERMLAPPPWPSLEGEGG